MKYISVSPIETQKIAENILEKIISKNQSGPIFIGLVGDLGAGKTSFVKGVAEFFGVQNTISSPTFVIQKIYEISEENRKEKTHNFKKLVHMDLYRLEDENNLHAIKWNDYKNNPDNIIFVEWPNQIWKDSPNEMILIKINHLSEYEREIVFEE